MRMAIDFICRSIEGKVVWGEKSGYVYSVSTDSRDIGNECLFIALRGERFDGHDFVLEAFAKGAYAAVVDRDVPGEIPAGKVVIKVADTLKALQMLAKSYRERFKIPVIAVTGSVGKTTTKEIIASLLARRFNTLKTEGNFNNDIGVPLTLFKLEAHHQAAVIELAMRALGEIDRLSYMVKPHAAVITNVEPVHLETLGSMENIARAKCEVLKYIDPDGFALINGDNQLLRKTAANYSCRKYTFGYNNDCDFRIVKVESKNKGINIVADMRGKVYKMFFPLPASKLAYNVVAGVAACHLLGIDMHDAISALAHYEAGDNRLRVINLSWGGKIIDDTYNANPLSMEAALETGKNLREKGRLVAVLGDMYELGSYEIEGHLEVGKKASQNRVDILVTVGKLGKYIAQGALQAGMSPDKVYSFADKEEAFSFLCAHLDNEDTVLFKASRGMKMEVLVERYLDFMENRDK
ncbi:UDP-N-acetylmuramoyl-tripeptide--D-alanyl-D-alanine ligase [Thermosyntropha lipolytica DSM 11003]|uniref:UDP-N-acetylmuramoyl-tripeptide--D-alanyl-D-alanine ligase n=1 Tax=Thermosyntropha lipolytica DSM 11003 TaxID=1123382 RepID=A0A1M5NYA7_9FIRM|nr:UDP-N-acetylmuramoyl-tripeptide--D-alanyl-D-alanine ligase [Thermosyntropha lipolytica]SHG94554.1 UDP-N-acetylmuramoyl-tripeptide--D-alanyl-D-alanine ligase [Thermosyntropha lipolytica DSM 11003]